MRVLMLLGVLGLVGCESQVETCTTIGCGLPFKVRFDKASPWQPGTYRVEVETDGVQASCQAQLPFAGCQPVAVPCAGPITWTMGLSGCALPADSHSISGVSYGDMRPATVKVSVFHDDRSIGAGTFTPTYSVSHPNGPDCDPECRTAPVASLALQ